MSFYRSILAAAAAIAIASPAFADDTATTTTTTDQSAPSATSTTTTDTSSTSTTTEKVNVNKASAKQLIKAGLSAKQAKAIVSYRKQNGDFKSLDELTTNVKSLKNVKSTTLDQLTVE